MADELVRTALYDFHVSDGAKIVDFHGYELPIWYSSIQEVPHEVPPVSSMSLIWVFFDSKERK